MATPPTPTIRDVLLELVHDLAAHQPRHTLQQSSLLQSAKTRLVPLYGDSELERAILTQWHDLFRTGLLAWGTDLLNPNPPFFHLTETGRRALENVTRDPSNPAGYLRHMERRASIGPIAKSYLVEGLDCYVAGLFKAAAVMVGAAAESVILDLRDSVVARLGMLGHPIPKALQGWQIRPLTKALADIFNAGIDGKSHKDLRDRYDTYWSAFAGQIRAVRNDAGHPVSIDPVASDTVHASLLVFPELAQLAAALSAWVSADMR
jgi:hypothetical protein